MQIASFIKNKVLNMQKNKISPQELSPESSSQKHIKQCLNKVWSDPVYFVAMGFGSGLMPFAPGTWGTVFAMPVYLLISNKTPLVYSIITVLAFVFGVMICSHVSNELKVDDYKGIVWDEIVGYLITMFGVPLGFGWMLAGFILFRIFDIWKPEPIRWIEKRVKGGLGIMLDDVIAAIPACLLLHVLMWLI